MGDSPARHIHPSNLVTYLALGAGLAALFAAGELRSPSLAGALIALSVLADTLDGRFARLFSRDEQRQAFGVQIDSLSDGVTNGVVPVGCLYLLSSFDSTSERWIWCALGFLYVVATLTRLGFYNVHSSEEGFIGIPAPVIGLVWSTFLLTETSVLVSGGLLLATAIAMVSPLRVPRQRGLILLAFLGWALALIAIHGTRFAAEGKTGS